VVATMDEVGIKVTGQNTSSPALDSAKRGMKGVADEAGATSAKVRVLGESVKGTTRATEALGDKARSTAREVSALDRRITELRASAFALGREFERTGETSLLKKFRAESRELAGLERMRKQMSGLSGDVVDLGKHAASTATTFASLFQGGLISALKSPVGAAVAASVAVPAVIGAGALAGGAVTAGVGAGVVGAGIAGGAMGSQRVRAEWDDTTAHIKARFLDATTSFEKPTIAAIGEIRDAVDDVDMEKIFGNAAKLLEPIAEGTAVAIRTLGGSVEYVTARAGPAMEALGGAIAEVASGIDTAMREIADGSEGGAEAIKDLGHALSLIIAGGGKFIGWLEDAYAALDDFTQALGDVYPPLDAMQDFWGVSDDTVTVLTELSRQNVYAADSMQIMGKETYNTADAADRLNDAFERLHNEQMSLTEANLAVSEGFIDLREELGENKKTLDDHTKAGIDNQQSILGQIELLNRQREAAIEAGNGTVESTRAANEAYRNQLEQLRKLLIQLGFAPAAVDAIIGKWQELANMPNITKTVKIVEYNSSTGLYRGQGQSRGSGLAHGGIAGGGGMVPAAASGMVVDGLVDVAEQGREIALLAPGRAMLPPGSQVIPNGTTENMLSRRGGGTPARMELVVAGSSDSALATLIERLIREGYITIRASAVVD
jgi:hypothetical protein